ncbi:Uncharacterised protein [Delftia tsuruhatensis]|uniref:hypothetical protein n=1 Tax=Delftia tsuruhatensis TaxID=180282 RepID=UPI001E707D5F|nr:hypothetical protein [Delftia tsuruhatensis]CAB5689120.1 Uncharacterised protein [Delftia tsuruhatensis]CAC9691103.1 Uncharacterised protein [Delftia tsuruhatensis]
MDSLLYMGVRITPDSRQVAPDQAQATTWLPHASLLDTATGRALEPVCDGEPCGTQADADARALRLARRSIMKRLHQG